jgi:hypothetical protein
VTSNETVKTSSKVSPLKLKPKPAPPGAQAYQKPAILKPSGKKEAPDHPPSANVSSITSWSDHMDEIDSISRHNRELMKELSSESSALFALDSLLLYSRAMNAKRPRTLLRGVLDTTRPIDSLSGIQLDFGEQLVILPSLGIHRHRLDHDKTTEGTKPPYRNPGKRPCESTFCPLNQWVYFHDEHKHPRNAQFFADLLEHIKETIQNNPIYQRDILHARSVLALANNRAISLQNEALSILDQVTKLTATISDLHTHYDDE